MSPIHEGFQQFHEACSHIHPVERLGLEVSCLAECLRPASARRPLFWIRPMYPLRRSVLGDLVYVRRGTRVLRGPGLVSRFSFGGIRGRPCGAVDIGSLKIPRDRPNRRFNEPFKTSQGEADPKRRFLQFDVQDICDNFEKEMMKALKDVSKIHMKSTSTRAHVAKSSLFISKKAKGKSENHVEEFKTFSDPLTIFDEYEEELIENLMSCEEKLTVLQSEHPSSLVLSPQVFEEEPLDYPHQRPRFDTRKPLDEDLGLIFDEEDEPDPVFDEEATSITSIVMKSHVCFDPGTTHVPLSPDLQEHCKQFDLLHYQPEMFVKISSLGVIRFGLEKVKDFCVSKSVFESMINSFKIFELDELLDQPRFQKDNGINSGVILSFDHFLKHSKDIDHFEKSLEFDLKQTDFCARKSFDSFVFKENGFDLSSSKYALITDDLFASSLSLDDVEKDMHVLKMNNIIAHLDKILVCNVYFDVHLERLKCVLLVLGKEILFFDLNKYMSCTFDPGLVASVFSIQERQVQPLRNERIDRAQQLEIWRSFVVKTSCLGDASDRGSVQNGYPNFRKVFCHESNFLGKPTHQGFTEAWNHLKLFTEEGVINFPNRKFSCPSIREYQTSKGDLGTRKKWPDLEPILHEPKVFTQSTSCPNQKHCKDHGLITSAHHENILNPRISKRKHIFTWLKTVLPKSFPDLFSLSCALKEIWKLGKPKFPRGPGDLLIPHAKQSEHEITTTKYKNPWARELSAKFLVLATLRRLNLIELQFEITKTEICLNRSKC
ncbi:hypothetical protein IGI04_035711 [Brassica rapa subsp. trilocularis]|uniref:Reverse transcriptase domain-containing protein n=1 Tax=Brassica rapa subsp. trilocularis TaxID=1813537 RepID=A0ABQ7LCD7_BRACM|nr:hypothetical protein IGI04_035711 [Brassica rapa subsp. trilocularis]